MLVNFNQPILNLEAEPLKDGDGKAPLTYRTTLYVALKNFRSDEVPTAELKSRCYELMKKIFGGNEVSISVSEAALILERVDKLWNDSLIYGRFNDLLNKEEPKVQNAAESGK